MSRGNELDGEDPKTGADGARREGRLKQEGEKEGRERVSLALGLAWAWL